MGTVMIGQDAAGNISVQTDKIRDGEQILRLLDLARAVVLVEAHKQQCAEKLKSSIMLARGPVPPNGNQTR